MSAKPNAPLRAAAQDLLAALKLALPLMRADRDLLVESNVRGYLDAELEVPDLSTLDDEAKEYITPYDAAIAAAEAAIAAAQGV